MKKLRMKLLQRVAKKADEVNAKISTRPEFSLVFVREKAEQVFEVEGKTEEAKGNCEDEEEVAKEKTI